MENSNKTSNFIFMMKNNDIEKTKEIRKMISSFYGPLRLRGRHSDRKSVLGKNWYSCTQNDIPWKLGEVVSFYIHDGNKLYGKINGEQIRKSLNLI